MEGERVSSDKPIWGTPGNSEQTPLPYQTPGQKPPSRKRGRKTGSWVATAAVLAVAGAGWAGTRAFSDGSSSGYERMSPQESGMCRLLSTDEVSSVIGGTAEYEDRIYDGDTCEYLVMNTDLGYNVTIRTRQRELDADMAEYYQQNIEDDITSTEAVVVEDVGEIAALDRPDHELDFISGGVQYQVMLDNNDYDDKRPSSEEDLTASADLARIILENAN